MRKLLPLLLLICLALPPLLPADAIVEEIIARINNQIVTRAEYLRSKETLKQEAQQQDPSNAEKIIAERDKDVLRDLIDQQLLLEKGKVTRQDLPPDDSRVEPYFTGFLSSLNAHLVEKNWKSIYFQHILDEPHGSEPPYYARIADLVHRNLPGVLTMDAVDASDIPEELKKNCDVWVPQLGRFDNQMELIRDRIQSGHDVWFYTCLFPNKRYLNRLIDYPLLKVRLLHWLNFRYGFTGFLHWGWNYWTPEPVKDTQPVIDANTQLLPPGDAFIVYPDRAGKSVYSSIRLEAMREGIEDYELLLLLKQKNPAAAEQLSQAAITSFTEYVRDPAAFRKIERKLLQTLSN